MWTPPINAELLLTLVSVEAVVITVYSFVRIRFEVGRVIYAGTAFLLAYAVAAVVSHLLGAPFGLGMWG